MTEHEKIMLRRHLERAAREYDRRYEDLMNDVGLTNVAGSEAAVAYRRLAADARDMGARIRTGKLT